MRTILVGPCEPNHLFTPVEPVESTEAEFELDVAKALTCIYPAYHCIVFGGTFRLDRTNCRPDLALIARDLSHWFVIEVEMVSHSFTGHVLPQLRVLTYGDPQMDCEVILSRELGIDVGRAATIIRVVPRTVAVIANKHDPGWDTGLHALGVQLLTVQAFASPAGVVAYHVDGAMTATEESLGFGQYSATDRSMRFPRNLRLPDGEVEIDDVSGAPSIWVVVRTAEAAWISRKRGCPDVPHAAYVMLARTYVGRLLFRLP